MLQQNASGYNLPIFFSETGCNTPEPRTFDDQSAIFGPQMDNTWSGAIIYEWIQETNNYGLVSYGPQVSATATQSGVVGGFTVTGTPLPVSPDFNNLKSEWATLTPSGVSENAYTPSATPPACPPYTSGAWQVSGDVNLPTIGASGAHYTKTGASSPSATGKQSSGSNRAKGGKAKGGEKTSFWNTWGGFFLQYGMSTVALFGIV